MPVLNDPIFEKVVIYVCEHNDHGAIGLIINRPTDFKLNFVLDQLGIVSDRADVINIPLLFGGPVHQDRGFVLHCPMPDFEANLGVSNSVSVSTSQDILHRIAVGTGPKDCLVTLGYAGWAANQLDKEIQRNIWLTCHADPEILYHTPYESRWQAAVKSLGIDSSQLVSASSDEIN